MKSSYKSEMTISDCRHKPSPAASKNHISVHQNVIPVYECFEGNLSKNHNQRRTKYPKRTNLAQRSDVLNKCSIRKLRRHFWTLFKTKNK